MVVSTPEEAEHTLRHALTTHKLCVVDYFAPWCHACRTLYPKLRQIAEVHSDVLFIKVRPACGSSLLGNVCAQF